MKKYSMLLLVVLLCFLLCACGSNNTSSTDPTDILENAVLIDSIEFYEEADKNIVKVKEEYNGKAVLFKDKVIEIKDNYIIVGLGNTRIKVYLSKEDIINVTNDQYVIVAGKINNIDLGISSFMPCVSMDMKQGYLVQNNETNQIYYEPLYNNATRLISENNYSDAIFILKQLNDYLNSKELLREAASKAAYVCEEGYDLWKNIFKSSMPEALTNEEIKEIIVGKWYSAENSFTIYSENGEYTQGENDIVPSVWFVENNRLVVESEYTRSEYVIYPFYKNAYVFCAPRAYNKVTSDVYMLKFLNGPIE